MAMYEMYCKILQLLKLIKKEIFFLCIQLLEKFTEFEIKFKNIECNNTGKDLVLEFLYTIHIWEI